MPEASIGVLLHDVRSSEVGAGARSHEAVPRTVGGSIRVLESRVNGSR